MKSWIKVILAWGVLATPGWANENGTAVYGPVRPSHRQPASDRDSDDRLAAALSNNLKYALPALALGFGMSHSRKDRETAVQVVDSLLVSQTATELLKVTIRDPRPEGREGFGFPSGHTSAAFAVATVLAKKRPRHRWLYYGLAAAVAWSRVERGAHDFEDVLGGAVLGLAAGHHSASRPGGLVLAEIRF